MATLRVGYPRPVGCRKKITAHDAFDSSVETQTNNSRIDYIQAVSLIIQSRRVTPFGLS